MDLKTCKKCGLQKPVDRFGTFLSRRGVYRPRGTCLDCRSLYHQAHADELVAYRKAYNNTNAPKHRRREYERRAKAREYVDQLKVTTPCADCGRTYPAVCMDFDHRPGVDKAANVSTMTGSGYKLDLIKIEIAKCDIVCSNCHRIRTAVRKENLAPLGRHRVDRSGRRS